jgi:hypothetical protein
MIRVFVSTVIGVIVGIAMGIAIAWGLVPTEFNQSRLSDLNQNYKDDYVVMIAVGYVSDRDVNGALSRLSLLGVDNVPAYVQDATERYITNSRDIDDIRLLVALSEGFGRLTAPMEAFCQLCSGGDS